jgi:AraC-like DNA-binding protein
MHYLRAIRLRGAREDLTNARGRDLRVTDVAMKWGFEHLGRFALAYRDFFGELPSAHLGQRAPCNPRSVGPGALTSGARSLASDCISAKGGVYKSWPNYSGAQIRNSKHSVRWVLTPQAGFCASALLKRRFF